MMTEQIGEAGGQWYWITHTHICGIQSKLKFLSVNDVLPNSIVSYLTARSFPSSYRGEDIPLWEDISNKSVGTENEAVLYDRYGISWDVSVIQYGYDGF